jgi:phenylalanyl-tRNA synthetase beta chain
MKISEHWLRQWVDPGIGPAELAEKLTLAGLEVDSVTSPHPGFSGVVIARIAEVRAHPGSDRLRICTVEYGGGPPAAVVSGAPNSRTGLRTAYAPPGAVLPGRKVLSATAIMGVESVGMLCSEAELGLGAFDAEIVELPDDAVPGTMLEDWLGLHDRVLEIDLTPNRGDCLSIRGIAREVGAICVAPVAPLEIEPVAATAGDVVQVALAAPDACPIYVGRVIRGVNAAARAPLWMRERLRRAGVRSIGALVDATNYVMLEIGQPLHAFDRDRLAGGITIRLARAGERLTLLDGQTLELSPDTLVIADQSGAIAMAGVMGGLDTGIGAGTTSVFLESAYFAPSVVAGPARRHRLQTDASQRFERGVSFDLQVPAIERATMLILETCGGSAGPLTVARDEAHVPTRQAVGLRCTRLRRVLGYTIEGADVDRYLQALGMRIEPLADGWSVVPPPFRFDVTREADLIEEVARLAGYDRMPAIPPVETLDMRPAEETRLSLEALRNLIAARGYREAVTYSFIAPETAARIEPRIRAVALANPISGDMAVMRTSLLPGLLKAYDYNRKRQAVRVRLFELGAVFHPGHSGTREIERVAGLAAGPCWPEQWLDRGRRGRQVDFFDVKADVEAIVAAHHRGRPVRFAPTDHPMLHPGQAARLEVNGHHAGVLGALHPRLQREYDFEDPVYLFELESEIVRQRALPEFTGISRFPMVRRDLSVVVDAGTPATAVLDCVSQAAGRYLRDLQLFDVYAGEGIDSGKKSFAIGLIFQGSSSTLIDEQVDAVVAGVVESLANQLGAALRE